MEDINRYHSEAIKNSRIIKNIEKNIKINIISEYSIFPLDIYLGYELEDKAIKINKYESNSINESSYFIQEDVDVSIVIIKSPYIDHEYANYDDQYAKNLLSSLNTIDRRSKQTYVIGGINHEIIYESEYIKNKLDDSYSQTNKMNDEIRSNLNSNIRFLNLSHYVDKGLNLIDNKLFLDYGIHGSFELSRIIASEIAKSIRNDFFSVPKKVLAVDFDNTLWSGILAEDGIENINFSKDNPIGYPYYRFQNYIKTLKNRGFLVVGISKNNPELVEELLTKELMPLSKNDFVTYRANYEEKYKNINEIAHELNLGLDSFVFIDDTLIEIDSVKSFHPEVEVILLDDIYNIIQTIENTKFFSKKERTDEDLIRTQLYISDKKRRLDTLEFSDYTDYLRSLNMELFVDIRCSNTERAASLLQRSNQFNLRTVRFTKSELDTWKEDKNHYAFTFELKDKHGTNGLISVVQLVRTGESELFILNWVMSCRVLKRQVESHIINFIVNEFKECDIYSEYIKSSKNKMVEKIYLNLGFNEYKDNKFIIKAKSNEKIIQENLIKVIRYE